MRHKMVLWLASILTTLAELDSSPQPSGPMYLALNADGCDIDTYMQLLAALAQTGCITQTTETITLTQLGREKANALNAAIRKP